jgi:hypothetical protein
MALLSLVAAAPAGAQTQLLSPVYTVSIDVSSLSGQPFAIAFDGVSGGYFAPDDAVRFTNFAFDGEMVFGYYINIAQGIYLFTGGGVDSRLLALQGTTHVSFQFQATTTLLPPIYGLPYVSDQFTLTIISLATGMPIVETTDPTGANAMMTYEPGFVTGSALLSVYAGAVDGTHIDLTTSPVPEPGGSLLASIGIAWLALRRRDRGVARAIAGAAAALGAAISTAADMPENVGNYVSVARTGYTINRVTGTYDSFVRITPNTTFELRGTTVYYVVDSIDFSNKLSVTPTGRMLVYNANADIEGKPAVAIPLVTGTVPSGSTITISLKLKYVGDADGAVFSVVPFIVNARIFGVPGVNNNFFPGVALPAPDLMAAFPINPETGRPTVFQLPFGALDYDATRRTPITAVAACTDWIGSCVRPGVRSLDDCAKFAPTCQTATPWMEAAACCPAACAAGYRATRQAGIPEMDAFFGTYLRDGSCFPQFSGIPMKLRSDRVRQ